MGSTVESPSDKPGSTPGDSPGLIWGFDFVEGERRDVRDCDSPHGGSFRWLHLNLADHGTRLWIEHTTELPAAVKEVLLSEDSHQQAVVEGEAVACVFHDVERGFDVEDTGRIGTLRVALSPSLVVSARVHPIGSADIARRRLVEHEIVDGPARALDLLVSAILQNVSGVIRRLSVEVQAAEDALIDERQPPSGRQLLDIRRRLSQFHRLLVDMQSLFRRLEEDEELPVALLPTVEKLAQRVQGVDGDASTVLGQLRLLRDEINHQSNQRINENLYLLSVMTALLLPTTLVTGIFGMNTGGLPLTGDSGTAFATLLAAGAALATYLFLRRQGFFR
ncbi:magnesium transporter CorA [Croceicoccus estronivorus]|uniref:CorA family divalent cation transporter n=1 Tax=Croceicoccus estronivorus TaxID=1172626 RepID=UPI00082A146F|nr:CorA family divalent cation transporter [Croceicoccus estronivorus]OCC25030.1 magnesium transporter CorA [Croceicoccus estronivorus]